MRPQLFALAICSIPLMCEGQASPDAATVPPPEAPVKELAPAELAAMMAKSTVFVYDCNEPETFAEAHVPGAIPTVYDEVAAEKLPADHDAAVIFYCYSPECPAAATAMRTAMKLGFTNAYCMIAGITGWQDAGLKTEP